MIGQTISHYRILEKIGEGGMGVVYKAKDLKLDRLVALKFLPSHLQANEETRKRFIHEAKAASALDHPNIITVHDIDHTPDGRMFIATSYYEGETLADRLSRGPMGLGEALDIFSQIAKGLARAHDQMIVHRDVKPANIFITRDNLVKIVDFGLAKLAGQTKVTKTGSTVGTVSYMSPEQARGEEVDHRSDIFSAGSVLYEMLTGRRPFPGDHEAAVLYAIVHEDPLPLAHDRPDLPASLQDVVSKMLAKEREARYGSMGEILGDLQHIDMGSVSHPLPRTSRRRRMVRVLASVGVMVLVAAGAFRLWHHFRTPSFNVREVLKDIPTEFVIAIAPFSGIDEAAQREGRVMQALIQRTLDELVGSETGIRIIGKTIEKTPRTSEGARSLGKAMHASVVVWGEVLGVGKEVEIQPYLTEVGYQSGESSRARETDPSNNESQSLIVDISGPDQIKLRRLKADEVGKLATIAAARFYQTRDPEKGLKILDGIQPPLADSERLRGRILARERRWAEAEAAYEAADSIAPESPWALIGLARVQQEEKKYEEAIATCKQAIERDTKNASAHYRLGNAYLDAKDYDAAIAEYEAARRLDSSGVWPYIGIGNVYMNQQRYADAINAYKKAITIDPSDPWPHVGLGGAYMYTGRHEERIKEYEKAVVLDTDCVTALSALAGCFANDTSRYDDAIILLQRCITLEPFNVDDRVQLAQVHENQGRLDLAREELEQAIDLKPEDPWPHEAFAYFHENRGDTSRAIEEYKLAIALRTEETACSACVRLGGIYLSQRRTEEAEALFRQAAGPDDDGFVKFFVGYQFLSHKHYARALEVYRDLVGLTAWSDVYRYMGWAYEGLGQWKEAANTYERGLALVDTSSASLADSMAMVTDSYPYYITLCRLGRAREAVGRMTFLADSLHDFMSRNEHLRYTANLVDFLAGRLSEKRLWKAAESKNELEENQNRVEAAYYIGMAYLLGCPVKLEKPAPDEKRARKYLEMAATIGDRAPSYVWVEEIDRAAFELKRLQNR